MDKKVIVVNSGHEDIIKRYGVGALSLYKDYRSPLIKLLRSIVVRINVNFIRFFYKKNWLELLEPYDVIVLFDKMNLVYVTELISNRYSNKQLILFFWNPFKVHTFKLDAIPKTFDIWTSDFADSVQYNMKYNGQFVFEKYFENIQRVDTLYDLYFAGIDKGRFKLLKPLQSYLKKEEGLKLFIRFVDPIKSRFCKSYSPRIKYSNMISESLSSKAILECNQSGQLGFTLRVIESLILQKKLVTNNEDIQNYFFYNSSNIFIWKDNNEDKIKEFLTIPFKPYTKDVICTYCFSRWLERIVDNTPLVDR